MDERPAVKRNFLFLTLEGCFFFFGCTFIDVNAVIPVFIDAYHGNLQLAGLTSTLKMTLYYLPQLFIGPLLLRIRNMPKFTYTFMIAFRPIPLLMIPILFGVADSRLTVMLFIILYSALWFEEGIAAIPWTEMFSRTIPSEQRGKLFGLQQFLGGVGGIFGGFLIKEILQNRQIPDNLRFSIIFGAAGVLMTTGALMLLRVKDDSNTEYRPVNVKLKEYFRQMPSYIKKNREFGNLMKVLAMSSFTGMVMPFLILFSKDTFTLDSSSVSTLVYIQIIGTLAGGVLWGGISTRMGNKYAIMASQVVGLAINGLATAGILIKPLGLPAMLLWPMVFLAGAYSGCWLGFINYAIEVVNSEVRTIYLVIYNLVNFPFSFLFYLAGVAANIFGFLPVFAVGMTAALAAILQSTRLKTPRQILEAGSG